MPNPRRIAEWVKLVSIAVIVIGLLVIATALPLEQGIRAVIAWVGGLGPVGPLVYAGIYLLVTVLMIPVAAFSIAAGALFGLFWGTVAVWLGSNLGAALALLIARYLARDAVRKKLARFPKFKAIDRAVAEDGWKIVAMLRLSPAVPFNVQNYVYGLTGIRFWPCVGASAVAMLPGIFMYVYLGYAGRASIEAAAAGEVQRGWGHWALLAAGLIATLVVTVYITQLARLAIAKQTDVEPVEEDKEREPAMESPIPVVPRNPWVGAGVSAGLAILVLVGAVLAMFQPEFLTRLFGPPACSGENSLRHRPVNAYAGGDDGRGVRRTLRGPERRSQPSPERAGPVRQQGGRGRLPRPIRSTAPVRMPSGRRYNSTASPPVAAAWSAAVTPAPSLGPNPSGTVRIRSMDRLPGGKHAPAPSCRTRDT